jgi:hypothetical protein
MNVPGQPWSPYDACSRSTCKRSKIDRIPHDFRRTAVRNLIRAGVDRVSAKHLVGHKTDSVFERYAITEESQLRAAVSKLAAQPLAHRSANDKQGYGGQMVNQVNCCSVGSIKSKPEWRNGRRAGLKKR